MVLFVRGAHVVVLITSSSEAEAEKIAKALLNTRLAACVNIVRDVKSFFWWEGRIDEAREVLLIVKTRADLLNELINVVKSIHSYSVPEIIALPIIAGYEDYLSWVDESVK